MKRWGAFWEELSRVGLIVTCTDSQGRLSRNITAQASIKTIELAVSDLYGKSASAVNLILISNQAIVRVHRDAMIAFFFTKNIYCAIMLSYIKTLNLGERVKE